MQQMITLNTRPQDAYRKQGVLTASPAELIVMLYDGLKKSLVMGKRAIEKRNVQDAHKYLMKAQDIVTELMTSLDMRYPISEELFKIYDFMLWSTRQANIRKDVKKLEPIIEMVDSLREAWYEVSVTSRGELHMNEA